MALKLDTTLKRNPRVVSRSLADGTGGVLLHLDSAAYHGINQVGDLVWNLLEEPLTFEQLLARLAQVFVPPPPALRDDIKQFVDDLVVRDLILVDDAGSRR